MSRSSGIHLRIKPGFSRSLAWFVLLTHLAATAVLLALPVGWALVGLLALFIALSFIHSYRTGVLRKGPTALIAAELDASGDWILVTEAGLITNARLHHSSFVRPWLTILTFATGRWTTRSLILLPDAVDRETLRRLRVRIRTESKKVCGY